MVTSCAPLGDTAVLVSFDDAADDAIEAVVRALDRRLGAERPDGVRDWVPAWASVAVHFDPTRTGYRELCDVLEEMAGQPAPGGNADASTPLREIPVRYGGDDGPDLEAVASHAGLSADEVVARHCAPVYRVAMIGFLPGFPYLRGLDPALAVPRLPEPRRTVPAGSVGIGGSQTGIYPLASPGGWRLIGRTDLRLFDPRREPPALLAAGDRVRFVPISAARRGGRG
jgi:KipI family sensor histidine kinase inhibitor